MALRKQQTRENWLHGLKVGDAVTHVKVTTNRDSRYVDDIDDDGNFLVGDRWFRPDGTSDGGLWVTYCIEPVTPETVQEVRLRRAVSFLNGMRWNRLNIAYLENIIAEINEMNTPKQQEAA